MHEAYETIVHGVGAAITARFTGMFVFNVDSTLSVATCIFLSGSMSACAWREGPMIETKRQKTTQKIVAEFADMMTSGKLKYRT